ncbi:MAG: alanine--tRNA ligase [Vigna little leaf phytoplasma]|nr:alanine--tRNA ligase [Vigna little leaf phytoplasma]
MKKLTSSEIRQMWLKFFTNKNHYKQNSVSLIPQEDPTLLWINAGITPLKKYLDGSKQTPFRRMVSIQKCLRTNDIENVGETPWHHTFFEMLGNFSIGDYFKKEAIDLAYELLTSPQFFALPLERLYVTYFNQDIETYQYWLQKKIKPEHLIPLKNNFWEIGEGPCGPCTEIFFDRGVKYDLRNQILIQEDIENQRFIEIWNIVFSQYNADSSLLRNEYKELPSKNIDTGAGLERLACILQQTETNFETDLFFPIIKQISFLSQTLYKGQKPFKIIADHIKAIVFGLNDGAIFSNIGRGYVLRKILRRAVLQGQHLNIQEAFLYKLVSTVAKIMEDFYPDLLENRKTIEKIIRYEEEKFLINLKEGELRFLKLIKNQEISSENFFKLYDTYGVPKEIILSYAEKYQIKVDIKGFDVFLQKQKTLSRSNQFTQHNMKKQNKSFLDFRTPSIFIGYDCSKISTKVLKVFDQGIVLTQTPFYATMGGQKCDFGYINDIFVTEIIRLPYGQFLHKVPNGLFEEGQEALAFIDVERRNAISFNHTAVHLLYEALKINLGEHIKQQGSYIDDKYLRFDFNHFATLSPSMLIHIEKQINNWIQKQYPVIIQQMNLSEARKIKAQFLDDTDYQESVRVVKIGDISIQLCGGTHARNSKDLEHFAILDYYSIGSGIYRLEATTRIINVTSMLKQKIDVLINEEKKILSKINKIQEFLAQYNTNIKITNKIDVSFLHYKDIQDYKNYLQSLKKDFSYAQKKFLEQETKNILKQAYKFIPTKIEKELLIVIDDDTIPIHLLKVLLDYLFNKLKNDVLCLCQKQKQKFIFLCKSKTMHMGNFISKINPMIDGNGGGNKNFGQACSSKLGKINEFITKWKNFL